MKPLRALSADEVVHLRTTIGLRCRRAREALQLSQRALARAFEMSPSWVREFESGDQFAPPYAIQALAEATNWSIGCFYGDLTDAASIGAEIVSVVERELRARNSEKEEGRRV